MSDKELVEAVNRLAAQLRISTAARVVAIRSHPGWEGIPAEQRDASIVTSLREAVTLLRKVE